LYVPEVTTGISQLLEINSKTHVNTIVCKPFKHFNAVGYPENGRKRCPVFHRYIKIVKTPPIYDLLPEKARKKLKN
jgi:hypothetical protein